MSALRNDRPDGQPPKEKGGEQRPAYLHSMNGMRFIFCIAVFCSHVAVLMPLPLVNGVLAMGTGSTFFFVLSGFTLTWLYTTRDRPLWFYGRRLSRFWPTLALGTAIPLAFALTAPGADQLHMLFAGLAAVFMVQAWIPDVVLQAPNPVTWTLSCLAIFYLLFPWASRFLLRRSTITLALIAIGLLAYGWALRIGLWVAVPPSLDATALDDSQFSLLTFGFYSPLGRIHEFAIGMVAAAALRSGWRPRINVGMVLVILVSVYAALWLFRGSVWRSEVPHDPLNLIIAPVFALVFVVFATSELRGRKSLLGTPFMEALGRWSLAFYLFHFTVLFTIVSISFPERDLVDFFFDPLAPDWRHAGLALIGLAVSLFMSWAVYRFYEAPLERRFRARLQRRFGESSTSASTLDK